MGKTTAQHQHQQQRKPYFLANDDFFQNEDAISFTDEALEEIAGTEPIFSDSTNAIVQMALKQLKEE